MSHEYFVEVTQTSVLRYRVRAESASHIHDEFDDEFGEREGWVELYEYHDEEITNIRQSDITEGE